MRRQFFRLFFSIILIILVVLGIQICFLLAINFRISKAWADEVLDEFADSISTSIANFKNNSSDSVLNLMVQNSSERISGLIVRDADGTFAISLGLSPRGIPVPQLTASGSSRMSTYYTTYSATRFAASHESNEDGVPCIIDAPRYEIALTTTGTGDARIVTAIDFRELTEGGKQSVVYPSSVKRKDIAGTVLITMDGEPGAYIDVIAYNLDYYNPTKFVVYEIVRAFIVSIPVAIIISILLAYLVSKRNEKVVVRIQEALEDLSAGNYSVDLPETKIDEYKDITHSIYKLAKDLKRHGESRKEWIKNISHDLNTPVTSMNLLLSGAEDGMFPVDDKLITAIKNENDTLKSRIASVTYYSYLMSPDVKCQMSEVSLLNAADEVLQSGKHRIKIEFAPELTVYADPVLLSRALSEVIDNADTYKEGDDSPIWRAEKSGNKTVLYIENRGKLPQPLPQFFEPWARGDDSRTEGGSGLGLSIVYQIMELHNGSVSISEKNGIVTTALEFPDAL